jgi:hypothetical protein
MISEILFWATGPVLPLGVNNYGKKVLLNLKESTNICILADSAQNKYSFINSILLGLIYQKLGFSILIVDLEGKYLCYNEVPEFVISTEIMTGYPLVFIDPIDNLQVKDLRGLSESLIIGVVKDLNLCYDLVSTCFNSKILFRLGQGRENIASKEIGVESLLEENDALFITHQGVLRLQTPTTNFDEVSRIVTLVKNKKYL